MGAIVAEVAADRQVPLIDFVTLQEQRSPNSIPGDTVFLDHVHPTIDSHRLLALEILKVMQQRAIANPTWDRATLERVKSEVTARIDQNAHAQALTNLSKVLGWAGKLREAYRLAAQAAQLSPENVAARYQAGLTAQLVGRTEESIVHYRKTVAIDPTAAQAHGNLGVALEDSGDLEGAIRHFRLALEYGDPRDAARNRANLERAEAKRRQE